MDNDWVIIEAALEGRAAEGLYNAARVAANVPCLMPVGHDDCGRCYVCKQLRGIVTAAIAQYEQSLESDDAALDALSRLRTQHERERDMLEAELHHHRVSAAALATYFDVYPRRALSSPEPT